MNLIEKGIEAVFGSKHERDIKRMRPMLAAVNALEPELAHRPALAHEGLLCVLVGAPFPPLAVVVDQRVVHIAADRPDGTEVESTVAEHAARQRRKSGGGRHAAHHVTRTAAVNGGGA